MQIPHNRINESMKSKDEKNHNNICNATSQKSVLILTNLNFNRKTMQTTHRNFYLRTEPTSMQFKFHRSLTASTGTAFLPN